MITRNRPQDLQGQCQYGFENAESTSNRTNWPSNYEGLAAPHSTQFIPRDIETGSTDSGKPPSFNGKQPRPTSFSSVSSGSSRASYLSDSLRLGALAEERQEDLPRYHAVDRVIEELIETESAYLNSLNEVIQGYLIPLRINLGILPVVAEEIETVFGNMEQLEQFHRELCKNLQRNDENVQNIANLLIENAENFKMYSFYCTNLPMAIDVLAEMMDRPDLREFFTKHQKLLGHPLPISTYLIKPFQRILKYPDLLKKLSKKLLGTSKKVEEALASMNEVADHINEFKRDHDDKLHLQDIQALLLNYEGPDLCSLGEFVLEGVMNQGKHTRFILLFHKLFILLKPHHDRLEVKHKIPTENLIVLEGSENNFSFSVQPFGDYNTKINLTVQSMEEKKLWCHQLKRLMMENHPFPIPNTAKSKILNSDLASRPYRRLARMSSLPILDRDKKRRSMKDLRHTRNVPESPQRHVQSLPRPSTGTGRLQISSYSPSLPHRVEMPKRSMSMNTKSHSISHSPMPGVTPFRKSSFDIGPVHESQESVFDEKAEISEDQANLQRLSCLSDSTSSIDALDEKLTIESDSDNESKRTSLPNPAVGDKSENRSSTQSAPGTLGTPVSQRNRISLESRTSTTSSTYSERIRKQRGRQARETEGIIKPGRVASILHRFTSTNRGNIKSIYYDSNSDEESAGRKDKLQSLSVNTNEVDHLSMMLDETLEDLEDISCDDDFSE